MTFPLQRLSVLKYANRFTEWHFAQPGPLEQALAPGFFNPAAKLFFDPPRNLYNNVVITADDDTAICRVDVRDGRVTLRVISRSQAHPYEEEIHPLFREALKAAEAEMAAERAARRAA